MNPPGGNDQPALLVLENFHRFLTSVEIIQAMVSQLHAGKQSRTIMVVLAPVVDLPPELEKLFVVVEHELPGRDQLQEIAQGIGTEADELPSGVELERVLDAASGLTRGEAESARMFGSFITWLNDRESDTFVVCTANDVQKLPPEFARAERFDGVFFLDLPTQAEKDAIWDIYFQLYDIAADQQRPNDKDWTGAEIKACCRLSVLLNQSLVEASQNVVPVAVTAAESIGKLRDWASGRCLDATAGGIYHHQAAGSRSSNKRRRNLKAVGPSPSAN